VLGEQGGEDSITRSCCGSLKGDMVTSRDDKTTSSFRDKASCPLRVPSRYVGRRLGVEAAPYVQSDLVLLIPRFPSLLEDPA
jgi:hypothetical protein